MANAISNVADVLTQQAVQLHDQGKFAEAVLLYIEVAEIRKQTLGEQHPAYAVSLNDLANLYFDLGDTTRAEPLLRQSLQIKKNALGGEPGIRHQPQ